MNFFANLIIKIKSHFKAPAVQLAPEPKAEPVLPVVQKVVDQAVQELVQKSLKETPKKKLTLSTSVTRQQPSFSANLDEEEQARRLLAIVVSRQATRFVVPASTTHVQFTDAQLRDGIKNKIVGKEGRNARAFEEKAGVDLLLNDRPNAVVISCFDPFRREVARTALEILVRDGRIQPAKIEEALTAARTQVETKTRDAAVRAAKELGLENIHPAILRVLGSLQYRTSFNQNQLEHAVETAWLCGSLASEMGFDPIIARRAGLLHDLGKALDQKHGGGHSQSGADFARKYGESALVIQAIASHHEEVVPETWLDHLVIAADALSGARPGARNGSTQSALERATAMEKIALQFDGVEQSYAVQAGRELRVFVDCNRVDDQGAHDLASKIAERVEEEVRFPGLIKVTILRELRATAIAQRK